MIAHWDIVQGTPEWYEIRYGKIGGTLCKSLLVESDILLKNVGSCYTEPFILNDDGYINSDMQRGVELEPYGRKELSAYTGLSFLECGWLQSLKCDLMGISPDGITKDFEYAVEIKCPDKEKHFSNCYGDKVPDDNIYQCIQYFAVNDKLKSVFFCSFRPESQIKKLFVKELKRTDIIELTVNRKKVSNSVQYFSDQLMASAILLDATIKLTIQKIKF